MMAIYVQWLHSNYDAKRNGIKLSSSPTSSHLDTRLKRQSIIPSIKKNEKSVSFGDVNYLLPSNSYNTVTLKRHSAI